MLSILGPFHVNEPFPATLLLLFSSKQTPRSHNGELLLNLSKGTFVHSLHKCAVCRTNPQRRSESYQGFAKYSEDLNRYLQTGANGLPSQADPHRSLSFTTGAGQAALAALRMHSQPSNQPVLPVSQHPKTNVRRANSLTAASGRSNSLQTYTYHPKGSYTPGQATISPSTQKRHGLLNRLSLISSLQPPRQPRLNSLNSQGSFSRPYALPEEDELEQDTVVTTRTTKVVDLQGRTQSITTETIRVLPDGSNIIETTTKNVSRSNSLRTNSLLASPPQANYNLTKIEEDLQDFDYNYQLDDRQQHQGRTVQQGRNVQQPKELGSPIRERPAVLSNELRANSITNSIDSTSRPLKSILKKKESAREQQAEIDGDSPDFKDATDTFSDSNTNSHPYKNFTKAAPPKAEVPRLPNTGLGISHAPEKSPVIKQLGQAVNFSHPPRHEDASSNGSIKFLDKVETIPIYNDQVNPEVLEEVKNDKRREEEEHHRNVELYNRALMVAHEKVFGNKTSDAAVENDHFSAPPVNLSPQAGLRKFSLTSNLSSLMENKQKKERRPDDSPQTGVNNSYRYENHHKDFASHSMRDSAGSKLSTRKERAKEEKQALKKKEKEKQEAEKLLEKELKKQEKEKRKSTKFGGGFFKKRNKEPESSATTQENSSLGPDSIQANPVDLAIPEHVGNERTLTQDTIPDSDAPLLTFIAPTQEVPVQASREVFERGSDPHRLQQVAPRDDPLAVELEGSDLAALNGSHAEVTAENAVPTVSSFETGLISPTVPEPVPEAGSEQSSDTIPEAPAETDALNHVKIDSLEPDNLHDAEKHSFPISVPVLSEITPETTLETETRDSFTEDDFASPVPPESGEFGEISPDEGQRFEEGQRNEDHQKVALEPDVPLQHDGVSPINQQVSDEVPEVVSEDASKVILTDAIPPEALPVAVPESVPNETLPTLVSGQNGAPVVLTTQLNNVVPVVGAHETAVLEPEEDIKEVNAQPTSSLPLQHRASDNQQKAGNHEKAAIHQNPQTKYKDNAHPEVIVKKPTSKKSSKFKEKIFKYFVNTYDKYDK